MSKKRVEREIAFVLHTWPYRETSVIVDCFTKNYGRIGLVAKGAKRPYSSFRGLLQTFRPLFLTWGGVQDLKTLYQADIVSARHMPVGLSWLCGCYINELIIKLLPRHDPHPLLFDLYLQLVTQLSELSASAVRDRSVFETLLRQFEKAMLKEIGYEIEWSIDANGQQIAPDNHYQISLQTGHIELKPVYHQDSMSFLGQSLLDIDGDDYQTLDARQAAKRLMRFLINHHLGGETLKTRRLLIDLQSF